MASFQKSVSFFLAYLSQSLAKGGSETTIYLSTIQTLTGETITTADFADLDFGEITIDPLTTTGIESCTFTGVDGTAISLTGVTRGLSAKGDDVSAARKPYHPIGTLVILTFGVQTLNNIFNNNLLGPASSTDKAIPRFSGTTGKLLQNSGLIVSDLTADITISTPIKSGTGTRMIFGAGDSSDSVGGATNIFGGTGNGANAGGAAALYGGTPGATGAGGTATIQGGAGGATSGNGGNVNILGGNATNGVASGGPILLIPGKGVGGGKDGKIVLYQNVDSSYGAILDRSLIASSDKTYTFPNKSGTFAMTSDIPAGAGVFAITTSATPSLVTAAGQRLTIWVKGTIHLQSASNPCSVTTNMKNNGSVVDTTTVSVNDNTNTGYYQNISFLYSAIPGAQTNNITFDQTITNLQVLYMIG